MLLAKFDDKMLTFFKVIVKKWLTFVNAVYMQTHLHLLNIITCLSFRLARSAVYLCSFVNHYMCETAFRVQFSQLQ